MSNERSPRGSCLTTMGTRGMRDSLTATVGLQMVAYSQPSSCRRHPVPPTVRREIVLPVERERAWALLTEPDELREWLADDVELEAEAGAPLRMAWDDGEVREGLVEEVEEERR